MESRRPDIDKLKQSVYDGLMSLVDAGEIAAADVAPMLQAFSALKPEQQTAEAFEKMIESARSRRRRSGRWRSDKRSS